MQCKDIPDIPILEFLAKLGRREVTSVYEAGGKIQTYQSPWGCVWIEANHSVQHAMPKELNGNEVLVRAKMSKLIKRGLISGCACGCRGDFELTEKGREMLAARNKEAQKGGA